MLIKWLRTHEFVESYDGTQKRRKLDKPILHDFDERNLLGCPPEEYPPFLSGGTPVVIKYSDNDYATNSKSVLADYQKKGKNVRLFPAA